MIKKIISILLIVSHFTLFINPLYAQHNRGEGGVYNEDSNGSYFSEDPFADEKTESNKSKAKNATLEGIQLLSEPRDVVGDSVISCYFIFKGNPSSYFFNSKIREKQVVFEFNDVIKGAASIESTEHLPILGYRLETEKVNTNEEIAGLKPEWHDITKLTFYFEHLPIINVKDEYGVVSFSFKWSTDAEKVKELVVNERNKPLAISLVSGGVLGLAALGVVLFLNGEDAVAETPEVSLEGLPNHNIPLAK